MCLYEDLSPHKITDCFVMGNGAMTNLCQPVLLYAQYKIQVMYNNAIFLNTQTSKI